MKALFSINESSLTLPELLSAIRFSFEAKEIEELQRILMRREEDLNIEIRKLSRDFDSLKEENDLLRKNHCLSELQKLDLEEELKKCRSECDLLEKKHCLSELEKLVFEEELKKRRSECDLLEKKHCFSELEKLDLEEKLNKHRSECDSLEKKPSLSELKKLFTEQELKKRKIETCEKATEESNGVEIEYRRKIMELTRENEKLKEQIELYSKTISEQWSRISGIEEFLAGLLETNASNFREENIGGHSPDSTSPWIRPSRNLTEIHNSHLQKEDVVAVAGNRENMSIAGNVHNSPPALSNSNLHESEKDASDVERGMNESVTAVPAALFPESAAIDVEVCVREHAVSPSTAAVDRPKPQFCTVSSDCSSSDSDVESISDSAMDALVKNIR